MSDQRAECIYCRETYSLVDLIHWRIRDGEKEINRYSCRPCYALLTAPEVLPPDPDAPLILTPAERTEFYRLAGLVKQAHDGMEQWMQNHLGMAFKKQGGVK